MKLWHKFLLAIGILLLAGGGILFFTVQRATYYEAKATEAQQLADVYWHYYVYWDYYSGPHWTRSPTKEEFLRGVKPPEKPPLILERIELPPSREDAKYKSEYYSQLAREYRAEAYRYRALVLK